MSKYLPPKLDHNRSDYQTSSGEITTAQADAKYLKNSGSLATITDLTVAKLFKAKETSDTVASAIFSSNQVYDFSNNGMVYSITADNSIVDSVSFINIPETLDQSYIFTYIIKPSQPNSPYYIDTSTITVNDFSITLYGHQNVVFPNNYTYLVQQITIIHRDKNDINALTSVSAY
jgi:hypothetical protein